MENHNYYTIKAIKKLYDIDIDYTLSDYSRNRVIIKIYLEFTPKEKTTLTPEKCTSSGKFLYDKTDGKVTWEDFIYIRKNEMPILNYTQQEYYLDNYCEDVINDKLKELIQEIKRT